MMSKNNLKGIVLAGGYGSRLFPLTKATSKHLLPVYDKPMIYYSISVLIKANIKDILIITTPESKEMYTNLFGNGNKFGINISYLIQIAPNGIAEAFIIAEKFIDKSNVCLVLGDNIFYSSGFTNFLKVAKANLNKNKSTLFSVSVNNPNQFGVIKFSKDNLVEKIIEKPKNFVSDKIISGLYFYTNKVIDIAKTLEPSERGELEISDINNVLIEQNDIEFIFLDKNFYWSDTGTYDSLIRASRFFQELEDREGVKCCCIEEIVYRKGFISSREFKDLAISMKNSDYGKYLMSKL